MAVNDQLLAAIKEHADFDAAIVPPVDDGFQVIAGTRQMPAELLPTAALRQALEQKGTTVVRSANAGGEFLVHVAPLKDFAGNTVAALLLPMTLPPVWRHCDVPS
ncbi:MAG: hypothetical protein JW781_01330 [Deltaproteobacteria bacterium]|nr:hypothetical protein [Candidatus Anaeroferrophillacea bacterium]